MANGVIAFDYLRDPRAHAVREWIAFACGRNMRIGALALLMSALTAPLGAIVQTVRLHRADEALQATRASYEVSERALRRANIYGNGVFLMQSLDEQLHALRASGDKEAKLLIRIANRLPSRSWLVSLKQEGSLVRLGGRADSFSALADTMESLGNAGLSNNPVLLSARRVDASGTVEYALRIGDAAP